MGKILTVGMAVYQEEAGAWFTISGLRANHPDVDIVVIDNAPTPDHRTRDVCIANGGRYFHKPNLYGTSAPRDEVFRVASTPWVMVCDAHVLFETDAIQSLIDYAKANLESRDLVQGPLVYDNGTESTHWRPTTPPGLWGVWDRHPEMDAPLMRNEVFEIPMQGLGAFAMRKEAWPGFNPLFSGFGGEEGYIHEVVRRRGGKAVCLPGLRWRHWFRNPKVNAPYNPNLEDHIWNLLIGHRECGIDAVEAIRKDFGHRLPQGVFDSMVRGSACQSWDTPGERPAPMQIHGIWYSNNAAPEKVLKASLESIKRAADLSRESVTVKTCPWGHIDGNPFPEELAEYRNGPGHLNIVKQQMQCLPPGCLAKQPDVICFLEHDVLYPPDYFDRVAKAFRENPAAPVVSNLDYIGLNGTGWLQVKELHEPLHQLSMRFDLAVANMGRCEKEASETGGCLLEPQGDRTNWARLGPRGKMPSVHINH